MHNLNPIAQFRQQSDIVHEKKLSVSGSFAQKMESKLKICIQISVVVKRKMLFFT